MHVTNERHAQASSSYWSEHYPPSQDERYAWAIIFSHSLWDSHKRIEVFGPVYGQTVTTSHCSITIQCSHCIAQNWWQHYIVHLLPVYTPAIWSLPTHASHHWRKISRRMPRSELLSMVSSTKDSYLVGRIVRRGSRTWWTPFQGRMWETFALITSVSIQDLRKRLLSIWRRCFKDWAMHK